jgi:hypothetical protein
VSTSPGQGGPAEGYSAALMATAERVRLQAQLPPQKDVLAAAALVLATAMTAMASIAGENGAADAPAADASAALRERVVVSCMLQICARRLSAGLSDDGWPIALDQLIAFAGTVVFAEVSEEEQARIAASGTATLDAMSASPHPRAAELKSQIETCFEQYVQTGEPKPLAALAALYEALRSAGRR